MKVETINERQVLGIPNVCILNPSVALSASKGHRLT